MKSLKAKKLAAFMFSNLILVGTFSTSHATTGGQTFKYHSTSWLGGCRLVLSEAGQNNYQFSLPGESNIVFNGPWPTEAGTLQVYPDSTVQTNATLNVVFDLRDGKIQPVSYKFTEIIQMGTMRPHDRQKVCPALMPAESSLISTLTDS